MIHYTELNFDLELSPSVLASSSEESRSDSEVSNSSSNISCDTIVTSNRTPVTNLKRRKRSVMENDYGNDGGVSYEEWCSVNIDIPSKVEVEVPAEGLATRKDPEEAESVSSSRSSVDMGEFSSSSSLGSSCELSPEELARICVRGETGADLSDAQRVKFKESLENSVKYEKSKQDLFDTFLGIIAEKGGKLSRLGSDIVEYEHKDVPALIKALNTAKNRSTRVVILDECLKLFAEFYRRDDGSMYAPGSLKTYYKRLFATLRLDYRVDIKVKYFAKKGSFRSVSTVNMQDARKASKEYGVRKGMSEICINDLEIVYSALQDKRLCPIENPYHLKLIICFILLRLYGLRAKEACNLEMDEVSFETYDSGPDRGKRFCQLKMDFDKTHKLKFDSPGIPKGYGKLKLRDNPEDDVFNAYHFMEYYCSKVNVGARTRRFVRRPIGRADFDASEETVWFNSLVASKNAITNTYRELEPIIGAEAVEFKDITAHGGRACLVTYSLAHGVTSRAVMQQTRHMNESGLIPYKRMDPCTEAVFQDVVDGVFAKDGEGREKKLVGDNVSGKSKSESDEQMNAYPDRKPAAVVGGQGKDQGCTEDEILASNINSSSDNSEIVKRLQHEMEVLKGKMVVQESAKEVLSSPAKKAKLEEREMGGRMEYEKRDSGWSGVASSGQREPESLLLAKIVEENQWMRRMMMSGEFGIERRMGAVKRESPFPSSNSEHLQQFYMCNEGMTPSGYRDPHQNNLPDGSRQSNSGLGGQQNLEQSSPPDTSSGGSERNGRRENGRRFPSITVPCAIM